VVNRLLDQVTAGLAHIEIPVARASVVRQVLGGVALSLAHQHIAEHPVMDSPHTFLVDPYRPKLLAGSEHPVRPARDIYDRADLRRRDADRLLAVDVLTALERRDSHFRV